MSSTSHPPELSPAQFAHLQNEALSWAHAHGLAVIPPTSPLGNAHPHTLTQHAPITLFPSTFPRAAFEEAVSVQKDYNELYVGIVREKEWLRGIVEELAKVDDFIAGLWDVYKEVQRIGFVQDLTLGLFRSDYMVHKPTPESYPQPLQVEFNTIASSFGGLSTKVSALHRFLNETGNYGTPLNGTLPDNTTSSDLAAGLAAAHEAYGPAVSPDVKRTGIIFLVQPGERNIFDQRAIEYNLLSNHKVPVYRLTADEIPQRTKLAEDSRALILYSPDGDPLAEISTVYLRSFYAPVEYRNEDDWAIRTYIEKSRAIKCPSVLCQLSGSKKVQQELCVSGVLEKFVDAEVAARLRKTFAKMYSFEDGPGGDDARRIALSEESEKYVLKPQREGGGNNIYRSKIPAYLNSIPRETWPGYILMELIEPPPVENCVLRGGIVEKGAVIGELGVYGVALWDSGAVRVNRNAGWLLRTKGSASEEGGVAAGFGCVDSVLLQG